MKRAVSVLLQPASAENAAVTLTDNPSATRLLSVTVCGEAVMVKLCPFTSNVPEVGGFEYVTITSLE